MLSTSKYSSLCACDYTISTIAPNLFKSSKNVGYDFATHAAFFIVVFPSAPSAATASAMAILWSLQESTSAPVSGAPVISILSTVNNKINVLKCMAYGFKDLEYFKLKIVQSCGWRSS